LADKPPDPLQIGFDIGNLVQTLGNDFDSQALQRDLGLAG